MIIQGFENSAMHITKDETLNKYLILVEKQISEGFHKSAKLIADNVESYSENHHSIEISGAHYSVYPGMDFLPMVARISKSRNYRLYNQSIAA